MKSWDILSRGGTICQLDRRGVEGRSPKLVAGRLLAHKSFVVSGLWVEDRVVGGFAGARRIYVSPLTAGPVLFKVLSVFPDAKVSSTRTPFFSTSC